MPIYPEVHLEPSRTWAFYASKVNGFSGEFPLGGMSSDLEAIYVWACALTFGFSLSGKIFLLKIVKMNLAKLAKKKSPKLLDQSKQRF